MLESVEVHFLAVMRLLSVVMIHSDLVVAIQLILELVEVHLMVVIRLLSVVMIHSDLVVVTQ